jgi:hypothetical protein
MKYAFALIALIAAFFIVDSANDHTPYCKIFVNTNGTWEGERTDCAFPEWGTFRDDGTWSNK